MATIPYQQNPNQYTNLTPQAQNINKGNQQVLQAGQNLALQGAPQQTLNRTSQATQTLLNNPSMGYNPQVQQGLQLDQYNRGMANQLEGLRQQTAPVANTGQNLRDLAGVALQIGQGRADLKRQLQIDAMNKAQSDYLEALNQGRLTAAAEQGQFTAGVDALAQARQMAEGEEQRGWQTGEREAGQAWQTGEREAGQQWQTGEREAGQAWQTGESALDRELTRDVEAGRITIEEAKLAQQATQFDTQMDFEKWALEQGIANDVAARAWQSSEAALDRAFDMQIEQVRIALEEKGWNFDALMTRLEYLPEEQAAEILGQAAIDAGMTYTVTREVVGNDGQVRTITEQVPGLAPLTKEQETAQTADDINVKLQAGERLSAEEYDMVKQDPAAFGVQEKIGFQTDFTYDARDSNTGKRAFRFTNAEWGWLNNNLGTVIQYRDGELYEVVDFWEPGTASSDKNKRAYVVLKNIQTGKTITHQ